MRIIITSIMLFFFSAILAAQTTSLFDLYELPTYSYNKLTLSGQDFFNYNKSNNLDLHSSDEHISANIFLTDYYVNQSPMKTNKLTSSLTYNYNKSDNESLNSKYWDENSVMNLQVRSSNNWYLNNSKGLFVLVNPDINYAYNFREKYNKNSTGIQAGAGYGRIIGMKSIVQAYIIADELELSLSDEGMVKMAELLDKYNDGFYSAMYRDDDDIEFYKDMAKLTGRADDAFRVQQILSSGLFKITERYKGCEFKLGTYLLYTKASAYSSMKKYADDVVATDMFASAEYALPVSFTTQIYAALSYNKNIDKRLNRAPLLNASVNISFMHNYNWETDFSITYQRIFPDEEAWPTVERLDDRDRLELKIRSEAVIINKFSIYAELSYYNSDYSNIISSGAYYAYEWKYERSNIYLGFNYYIL